MLIDRSIDVSGIKRKCNKALNSFKSACDSSLINLFMSKKNIKEMKITYDMEKGKLRTRNFDFELPKEIIGDISELPREQVEEYINILKNATLLNKNKNIIGIGLIDKASYNNIISGHNTPYTDALNISNQRFAKHILSFTPGREQLKCQPYNLFFDTISGDFIVLNYVCGSLDNLIKDSMGKLYKIKYDHSILQNLHDSMYMNLEYQSDEEIKAIYKKNNNIIIGEDWSGEQKYRNFIELLGKESTNADFMASQLLFRGFIYCSDVKEHIAIENFYNAF